MEKGREKRKRRRNKGNKEYGCFFCDHGLNISEAGSLGVSPYLHTQPVRTLKA